jgi:hypothetical protein
MSFSFAKRPSWYPETRVGKVKKTSIFVGIDQKARIRGMTMQLSLSLLWYPSTTKIAKLDIMAAVV